MSIHDILHKINRGMQSNNLTLIYILIIIIVGLCSFLLGRLSALNGVKSTEEGISIVQTDNVSQITKNDVNPQSQAIIIGEGKYVASKNGKLYYPVNCKGANRIKPDNRVWFDTVTDAEKSGYTPSSSCK